MLRVLWVLHALSMLSRALRAVLQVRRFGFEPEVAPPPHEIDSKQNSTSPHDLTKGAKKGGIGQKCSFRFPEKANRTAMLVLGMTITAFAGGEGGAAQPQNRYANQHTPGGGRGSTPPRYERNENQADYNHLE